nr:MAG TPA: hypothetical protein [Caudoviricetes sp.]DAZ75664.1 MAG TPA: hypothetical protein [Caudoviricetes sp.]
MNHLRSTTLKTLIRVIITSLTPELVHRERLWAIIDQDVTVSNNKKGER